MKIQIKEHQGLFILPLLSLPFLILIFYVLGGGTGSEAKEQEQAVNGANYHLPDADQRIDILDKQEAYMQMESQELALNMKLDVDTSNDISLSTKLQDLPEEKINEALMAHVKKQEKAARVAMGEGVEAPKEAIKDNGVRKTKRSSKPPKGQPNQSKTARNKIRAHQKYDLGSDMEELEDLLNEHEKQILQNDSLDRQVYHLQKQIEKQQKPERKYHAVSVHQSNGFEDNTHQASLIKAQIVEDSKVMTGKRIMMRLLEDTYIDGKTVKANALVYGLCKTNNERLLIQVSSVFGDGEYLPVNLSAYDLDGIKGLYVPDHVVRKVYKDAAGGVNPSMMLRPEGSPLAYMGLDAASDMAQTMFKQVRLKKVFLRKNTVLILRNE